MFGSLLERVVELGLPLGSAVTEGIQGVLFLLFPRTGTGPITAPVLVGIPVDGLDYLTPTVVDVDAVGMQVEYPIVEALRAGHIVASLERMSVRGITLWATGRTPPRTVPSTGPV